VEVVVSAVYNHGLCDVVMVSGTAMCRDSFGDSSDI